jgi:hypothetical protein
MMTYFRVRTAPWLPFDDVKSEKAGTTHGGILFFILTHARRSGTDPWLLQGPVRQEL